MQAFLGTRGFIMLNFTNIQMEISIPPLLESVLEISCLFTFLGKPVFWGSYQSQITLEMLKFKSYC